ncbi:MAG: hypothetical protein M3R01_12175, partial [Actinomycetota bacterium]|nr:hypothetical protein [Actinomycetota bacterium]
MARARTLVLAGVAVASLAVAGAVGANRSERSDGPPGPPAPTDAASPPTSTTPSAPACQPASLGERAGSVLVVGLPGVVEPGDPLVAEVTGLGVGGVLLTDANVAGTAQARSLVGALRGASPRGLLVTIDEEGGRVTSTGRLGPRSPSARRLGRQPAEAVREA